jgi:YesN/AraC family two-component response regulator
MPVLNGIELLSRVKQIRGRVTSILISAFEIGDKVFENCGCVDKYLHKPVTIRALLAKVETFIDFIGVRKQQSSVVECRD